MDLRKLLIERIMFVLTDEELAERYMATENDLLSMDACDLLELYEDCFLMID
jgi:hypothetical protein